MTHIDYCPNSLPGDNVTEFGCTSEEQEQQGNIYLDSNGITVKANPWAITGHVYSLNGVEYTIVDDDNLCGGKFPCLYNKSNTQWKGCSIIQIKPLDQE